MFNTVVYIFFEVVFQNNFPYFFQMLFKPSLTLSQPVQARQRPHDQLHGLRVRLVHARVHPGAVLAHHAGVHRLPCAPRRQPARISTESLV